MVLLGEIKLYRGNTYWVIQNMQKKHLINMATKQEGSGKGCFSWRRKKADAD